MGYTYFTGETYFITGKTFLGKIFFNSFEEKNIVQEQIIKAQKKFDLEIFSYVILSNHYHLLLISTHWRDIPKALQVINGGSSFRLNKIHKINRSIWGERWSKSVNTEGSLYNIIGYILGNPYKHGLVDNLLRLYEYPFSNYKEYVKENGLKFTNNLILESINLNLDLESEENFLSNLKNL